MKKEKIYGSHCIITFLCEDCNNFYQFELRRALTLKNKYNKYLCPSCRIPYAKESRKKTNIEKYGVPVAMNTEEVRKKRIANRNLKAEYQKTIETRIRKYGSLEKANAIRLEKCRQTNLKKYGVENPQQNKEIHRKAIETRKQNNALSTISPTRRKNYANRKYKEFKSIGIEWLDKDSFTNTRDENGNVDYTFKCLKCGNIFKTNIHSNTPTCKKCHPKIFLGFSKVEKDMANYIKSIYNGVIFENYKDILPNRKELDIYLPELNLAFEMNGYFFHGQKSPNEKRIDFIKRAEEKRLLCKEKGIQLINIDDIDWNDRPEVFKRFIDDKILPRKKIYARQCEFKEVDTKTAKDFCEFYHVNGYRGGYYKCALFYNNEPVVVAVFGKHQKYENECIRLCYKTGYDVIGGWEKIQKHFGKPFLHYINLKYFDGENKTGCGYRFVYKKKAIYRQELQKKKLLKMFNDYDESMSDYNNCLNHGYVAIYDCGNDIRVYNKRETR